ncbi:MAG: NAD-dependent protein deacylase [Clostridiales bacterium]|nr:NAD-dependent protein deacylase [Clostridiales bacterium]
MDFLSELQSYIDQSKRIVFFGGAGVSTESGIPDFRSVDGLYSQSYPYPPERIVSHSFFLSNPEVFFDFYRGRVLYLDAEPNPAHRKLAELEKAGKLSAIITQNIDGLHQKAGSRNVLELHGSIWRNYCIQCQKSYDISALQESTGVPRCACGGAIRPDVVLYEEALDPLVLQQSERQLRQADLLIVGGTSLVVYPAAGLLQLYRGPLILINRTETPHDRRASMLIRESIGEVFEQIRVEPT